VIKRLLPVLVLCAAVAGVAPNWVSIVGNSAEIPELTKAVAAKT